MSLSISAAPANALPYTKTIPMKLALLAAALLALASPAWADSGILPDPTITPGAVRTINIGEICSTGTRELRHWDRERDDRIMAEYGLPAATPRPSNTCASHGVAPHEPLSRRESNRVASGQVWIGLSKGRQRASQAILTVSTSSRCATAVRLFARTSTSPLWFSARFQPLAEAKQSEAKLFELPC